MPWRSGPVDDRIALMQQWESGDYTVVELAEEGGVTRQCVHKWIKLWKAHGEAGMLEKSRAPINPRRTDPEKIDQLLALKRERPECGPEKLVAMLSDRDGNKPMAVSTAGRILAAYGQVKHRKFRVRVGPPSSAPRLPIPAAGHTLTADHKGYFMMGNGKPCYALTVADPISRYLYAIDGHSRPTVEAAWKVFDRLFRDFGLPDQILTDNGVPFCSAQSLGGLTELSKMWIKLGIHVARIDAGRPQQNGAHERMHRTLKDAIRRSPRQNMLDQQRYFDEFRYDYNWLRPHKALGLMPPAEQMAPFRRSYSGRVPTELSYPTYFEQRKLHHTGELRIAGRRLFLTKVLAGEVVGLHQIDDRRVEIYFGTCRLGWIDLEKYVVVKDDPENE